MKLIVISDEDCFDKEHEKLYEEIAERGCVLSEYPPGTVPRVYNFPKRNRLIAGLSDELYVIDAGRNGGALSTVDFSRKYGRGVIVCEWIDKEDCQHQLDNHGAGIFS